MNKDIFEKIQQIMADLFNVDSGRITESTSMVTLPEWDSLQHLNLILDIEMNFRIALAPEDTERMTSVSGILEVVEQKQRRHPAKSQ